MALQRGDTGPLVLAAQVLLRVPRTGTSDAVSVNAPAMAVFSARVSAADTLAITFFPPAAGSYTPPSGVYRVLADRS